MISGTLVVLALGLAIPTAPAASLYYPNNTELWFAVTPASVTGSLRGLLPR